MISSFTPIDSNHWNCEEAYVYCNVPLALLLWYADAGVVLLYITFIMYTHPRGLMFIKIMHVIGTECHGMQVNVWAPPPGQVIL